MRPFSQSCLAAVLCAVAFVPADASANVQTIIESNSSVWGAVGGSFLNYKEAVTPLPNSEHGWLPSFAIGAGYMTAGKWYFAGEASFAPGTTNYNGAISDSDGTLYPYKDTTESTVATANIKVGHGFSFGSSVMATPYLDVGYHYWKRSLDSTQVEDYHHIETLIGAMLQVSPINRLVLSAYAAGGLTFGAGMELDDMYFKMGRAGMYKVGAKVGYDLTKKLELFSSLDFKHFRYASSDLKYILTDSGSGYIREPGSFSNYATAQIGLAYHLK